jgi:hypothetical protein
MGKPTGRNGREHMSQRGQQTSFKSFANLYQERRHVFGNLRFSLIRMADQARGKGGVICSGCIDRHRIL